MQSQLARHSWHPSFFSAIVHFEETELLKGGFNNSMNSIIVLIPRTTPLIVFLDKLRPVWQSVQSSLDNLIVEHAGSRVYIYIDDSFRGLIHVPEMCDAALVAEFDRRPDSTFLFVDYSDWSLAAKVLMVIADTPDYFLDDGNGLTGPGSRFIKEMQKP